MDGWFLFEISILKIIWNLSLIYPAWSEHCCACLAAPAGLLTKKKDGWMKEGWMNCGYLDIKRIINRIHINKPHSMFFQLCVVCICINIILLSLHCACSYYFLLLLLYSYLYMYCSLNNCIF
jgi:hypothetical protein